MHHPIYHSTERFATLRRSAVGWVESSEPTISAWWVPKTPPTLRIRSVASRSAFTLVEMLVVLAIIVGLLGLVAAVAPRFGERQRPSQGAGQLQSWLNLAKNRALNDQAPRGIRIPAVSNPAWPLGVGYVTELQFIESPRPFSGGTLWMPFDNSMPTSRYNYVLLVGVELPTGDNAAVQAGDILKVNDPPCRPRRIRQITPTTDQRFPGQIVYVLSLDQELSDVVSMTPVGPTPPPPAPLQFTYGPAPAPTENYEIFRAARPIRGEPVLTLPRDVGIDISRDVTNVNPSWYRMFPSTANNGGSNPFDILFEPSGRVIGNESTLGSRICLWVRDISSDSPPEVLPDGDNTLITIYTRTGQITAHPVDSSRLTPGANWNPFFFTQDGRSSGGQ